VIVNSLRPAPHAKARDAVGEQHTHYSDPFHITLNTSGPNDGPNVILLPSAGREASDFNELVKVLNGRAWEAAGGVPMLVVQPTKDRIAPKEETADVLKARFPDQVEVVVVENAGHALLPEQPEAIAEAILAFLAKHHPVETND